MPPRPGEPLTKVTLNLFASDVSTLRDFLGTDWTVKIRELVRKYTTSILRAYEEPDSE